MYLDYYQYKLSLQIDKLACSIIFFIIFVLQQS
jgi:hypothetical protein